MGKRVTILNCLKRGALTLLKEASISLDGSAWYVVAVAVLFGLAVGSFLNVVIDRLPAGQSLAFPPSHCSSCLRALHVKDLVPVLSFLWLRGRCRYCGAPIPRRLPLMEALTGLLFGFTVFHYGLNLQAGVALGFVSLFLVIIFIDAEHGLILNRVVYPGMILALLVAPIGPAGQEMAVLEAYWRAASAGALGFAVMLAIYLAARGGMGTGDVKLGGLVGLAVITPGVLVALLLSFLTGGLVAAFLLLFKLRARKDPIPFGPFLSGAGLLALYYGPTIYQWYGDLFL